MTHPLDEARDEIISSLKIILSELNYDTEIKLEIPPDEKMGGFAFACFSLAPAAKKAPQSIAAEIAKKISKGKWIKNIEAEGGYVNFFLDEKHLTISTLQSILKEKERYGYLEKKRKKVIVEHTSANPNGPLHVGRARNPIIGDTIVRIFKAAGYDVESQFYLDDMGKQVAILAWGINNKDKISKDISKYYPGGSAIFKDNPEDHQRVVFYQVSSNRMQEDAKVADEINEIVKQAEEGKQKTIEMVHNAYNPVLKGINESLERINITVDKYVPESNFVKDKSVDYVVKKLKQSKYCDSEEGAYYLDTEPFGVKGRSTKFFFTRKDNTTLYATRDVAYHLWKAKHADILINVLGEDHKLESQQVEIALNLVGAKLIPLVIFYSFVSLPGGKMSTRQARVVYLDELIDECIERAYKEVKKRRGEELSEQKMKEIAEIVGTEDALNFEGDAAPFIQYAHARACSILEKKEGDIKDTDVSLLLHPSEIQLTKKLAQLPVVVDEACKGYRPHSIATYVYETASRFNQFYRDCPVLPEKNKKLRDARLALVDAAKIVLKNGLDLLGITAPEEM